ncbi:hypothetical protein NRF20_18050 [Streptomyces sp. R-74717]|uniref:hypothetical protein n=1 Tax=Streptomyces sp. R-74717 TaxID=2969820 RepID=UPI0039B4B923
MRAPEGSGSLRRLSGKASLDPAAWWAAAAARPGALAALRAPATARLNHRLGVARLHLGPRPAEQGRWSVDVTLTCTGACCYGRSARSPCCSRACRCGAASVSSAEQAAAQWNETLGRVLAQDLDELRAEPADHVVRDPDDEAG